MHDLPPIAFVLIGALLSIVFLWLSLRSNRLRRLVIDTPTSKTTGVFIGFNELKGRAISPRPFTSHISGRAVVFYDWDISEHWSRTVRVRVRDKDGKMRTETRRESGWQTVDRGGKHAPFFLEDDHGTVLIRPSGAEIEDLTFFSHTCGRNDPLYYKKGPRGAVSNSDHRRRFTEIGIPIGTRLYVLGQARERQDIVAAEIALDEHAPEFLISTRSEDQVAGGRQIGTMIYALLGAIAIGGGIGLFTAQGLSSRGEPNLFLVLLGVLTYGLIYFASWGVNAANSLIRLRNRARHAFSLIEVQLKRRNDLIPQLVEITKASANHEGEVQESLADLRSAASESNIDRYHPRSPKLRALSEAYPEIRSDELFRELHEELTDTENRIALARNYYNDAVTFLNTRTESFPDSFLSKLAGVRPMDLYLEG